MAPDPVEFEHGRVVKAIERLGDVLLDYHHGEPIGDQPPGLLEHTRHGGRIGEAPVSRYPRLAAKMTRGRRLPCGGPIC